MSAEPAWAGREAATARTLDIAEHCENGDFAYLIDQWESIGSSPEELATTLAPYYEHLGAFKEWGSVGYTGAKDESGKEYFTVVQRSKYENGTGEYRLSYYEDGEICGFYFLVVK